MEQKTQGGSQVVILVAPSDLNSIILLLSGGNLSLLPYCYTALE